ncbi:MAG: Hsp20/alpha crystallin family protein [Betaproteobacteria bacterium]|nr:Hsp20/alpha crystallin family protein [Betaproteobacteria bacterium]
MANLIRRDPLFARLSRFDPLLGDDWLKGFWVQPFTGDVEPPPQIKIDLTEGKDAYTVRAEVPGMKKDDIKVEIEGNRVSISAESKRETEEKKDNKVIRRECYQGSSYRSFILDSDVDETRASAKYNNGVLELTLPKKFGAGAKQLQIS